MLSLTESMFFDPWFTVKLVVVFGLLLVFLCLSHSFLMSKLKQQNTVQNLSLFGDIMDNTFDFTSKPSYLHGDYVTLKHEYIKLLNYAGYITGNIEQPLIFRVRSSHRVDDVFIYLVEFLYTCDCVYCDCEIVVPQDCINGSTCI